jgi:long-chain acyl-CoA synthetase
VKNYKHIDQDVRVNGQKNPSKPVLFHKDKGDGNWKGMTWSDALADSEKVSKSLIDFGLEVGDRVAIFSQNSPEWILADIGILSIRAVTVPIYATNSAKEAEYYSRCRNLSSFCRRPSYL